MSAPQGWKTGLELEEGHLIHCGKQVEMPQWPDFSLPLPQGILGNFDRTVRVEAQVHQASNEPTKLDAKRNQNPGPQAPREAAQALVALLKQAKAKRPEPEAQVRRPYRLPKSEESRRQLLLVLARNVALPCSHSGRDLREKYRERGPTQPAGGAHSTRNKRRIMMTTTTTKTTCTKIQSSNDKGHKAQAALFQSVILGMRLPPFHKYLKAKATVFHPYAQHKPRVGRLPRPGVQPVVVKVRDRL